MNDPVRLIQSDDEFARALLGSAKQDAGSDRALGRTLAAVSGALATLSATSTASATVGVAMVAKWLGVGALLGAVTSGTVTLVEQHFAAPASPSAQAAALGRSAAPPSAPESPKPRIEQPEAHAPSEVVSPAASVTKAAPQQTGTTPLAARPLEGAPSAAAPSTVLERELGLLESARQSLNRGDPAGGLAALARYRAQFPSATLGPEATLLEIQAHAERGDVASARRIGSEFLRTHPSGPYAARAHGLLGALAK